jgi:hypothetical protein
MSLEQIFATVTLVHFFLAKMTLDTIVGFVIPLVALLTSGPVMWRKERLRNISVVQRVHLYNLVFFFLALS